MSSRKFFGAAWLGSAMLALPAAAHHSFDFAYDAGSTTTLDGIVSRVEWINPHAFIHFNVNGDDGAVMTYRVELGPPYALSRGGWTRDTLRIGDAITIENAALARDGSPNLGATRETWLILASGERLVLR